MRLDPPSNRKVRVHELAKELGWPSSQLVDELCRRGEYVKSATSTIVAPVVRAIRREFATAAPSADPDESLAPTLYGRSAELTTDDNPHETFAAALARIKAQPPRLATESTKASKWRPAILQALLDEVIAQRQPHLSEPDGGHFAWELKKATKLHCWWAEARLNGLSGDDTTVIKWIRLGEGHQPRVAADLSRAGITPDEAALRLGYGGRTDPRMGTLFERFRDQRMNRSEVIAAVRLWHRNNAAS